MLFDRLDITRLRRDIASISTRSLALKALLRRTWERPMADEQRSLARLRRQATELHVLLARTRGRWHVATPPRDAAPGWDRDTWNQRVAERAALDYAAPEGGSEVVAS